MPDLWTPVLGGFSGVVADVISHPIATVKTRIQVQGAAKMSQGLANEVPY